MTYKLAVVLFLAVSAFAAAKEDEVRFEVARQWAEKGEYDKAVQELRMYLSDHPDAAEVYARIGSLRLRQGNAKLASENFKIALSKNPSVVEAHKGLAQAYEKMGEGDKALAEWKRLRDSDADPETKRLAAEKVKSAATGSSAASGSPAAPAEPKPSNAKVTPVPGNEGPTPRPAEKPRATVPAPAEAAYSPALDSASGASPRGIYATREFQDALRHYREKKTDSALTDLKKCLARNPGHPGAYYLGGVIRYEKGDYSKAAYNFKRSFGYPDRGFNAHFYLGRIYQREDRNTDAIAAYQEYLKDTKSETGRKQVEGYLAQLQAGEPPKAPEVKPGQGNAKVTPPAPAAPRAPAAVSRTGGLPVAADGLIPFLAADSASAAGRKIIDAYDAFKDEKYEKAATMLKDVIRGYGGSQNAEAAALDLAAVYIRLGLWDNARDRVQEYLAQAKQPPRFADAANYLSGLIQLGKKDGDKAERSLLAVNAGGPEAPPREEVDFRLAQAGALLQDNKKWSGYLEKAQASAVDPHRKAALWQQLGFLHSKFGSAEKALEFFRKSQEDCKDSALDAICAESQLRMADLEFKRKGWKAALNLYRQFATKHPGHAEAAWAHYQMANVYRATNNFESALNEYKQVIDNYPDSYWAAQAKWKREDTIWRKEYEEVLD